MAYLAKVLVYQQGFDALSFQESTETNQTLAQLKITTFWTQFNTAKALGNMLQSPTGNPGDSGELYIDPKQVVRVVTYVLQL